MSESETESAKCQMWVYFWRANIVRLLVPNKKEKKKNYAERLGHGLVSFTGELLLLLCCVCVQV